LLARVARQLDDLETVAQRPRNRIELVRRRDEQHLRQVERHLEVVIGERVVLLGIEHLEERARRVAPKIVTELVDLVEHEHGIARPRLLDALDDEARQRADVRAPVAADLGLLIDAEALLLLAADLGLFAHVAEREEAKLAPDRARDRSPERRLADAGGPD